MKLNTITFPFVVLAVIFCAVFSWAGLAEVETAIMNEDYKLAQESAVEFLNTELDDNTRNKTNYYLALSYLHLSQYEEAQKIFSDLVQKALNPLIRDQSYLGLMDSLLLQEQYKKVLETGEKILRVSPKSEFLSLIYFKLARANLKLANWSEARSYLKKIILDFPDSLEDPLAKQLLQEKQYFAVQVGSFADRQRAESLVMELKNLGEYAYCVETVDQQDRKFYRVRVGQLALLDEAKNLEVRLSKQGYPTQIFP